MVSTTFQLFWKHTSVCVSSCEFTTIYFLPNHLFSEPLFQGTLLGNCFEMIYAKTQIYQNMQAIACFTLQSQSQYIAIYSEEGLQVPGKAKTFFFRPNFKKKIDCSYKNVLLLKKLSHRWHSGGFREGEKGDWSPNPKKNCILYSSKRCFVLKENFVLITFFIILDRRYSGKI